MKGRTVLAALALASSCFAQVSKKCADGICWSLNVPKNTGSSGDIFFQISAPTSLSWTALGQGTSMTGSNMFVVYLDSTGKNVTLSPRLGKGEKMPLFNSAAQVSLLEGSGVKDGKMVANIRCESCTSWDGGKHDFTSSAGSWIWAYKMGDGLDSNSESQRIQYHDKHGDVEFDFAAAKGGNSVNPLIASAATPVTNSSSSDDGDTDSDTGVSSEDTSSETMDNNIHIAHGVLAGLAFVVFWPLGAIIISVLSFSGLIWVHAAIQAFAFVLFIAAFGLGIWLANSGAEFGDYHPIIGIILFGLAFIQPVLGMVHHRLYKKYQRRTLWSHAHIWLGRIIITVGIINGGLGLLLADDASKGAMIAYGVVGGVFWLAYVLAAVYGEIRRSKARRQVTEKGEHTPIAASHSNAS